MAHFYTPTPSTTDAYHKDASGHEYYGKAPKGKTSSQAAWQIFKMEYTGDNWIILYPADNGIGSDQPKFVWDDVETYTYVHLGCTT